MKNFMLQFSAAQLRATSYQEKEVSLLSDIFPCLMAYAMYASPCGESIMADSGKNDEYYRKVSGLGVGKWKAAKAWLKKAGWLDYIPERDEGQKFERWRVVIKAPGLNFWTQYEQAEAVVTTEGATGTVSHPVGFHTSGGEATGTVSHPVGFRPPYNDKDSLEDNDKDSLEGPGLENNPARLELEDRLDLELEENPGRLEEPGRTFTHPVEGWSCENRDDVITLYQYNYNMITSGKNRKVLNAKVQEYSGSREEFIQSYLDFAYTSDFKIHEKTNLEKSLEIHLGYQLRGQTHARAVQEDVAKRMAKNTVENCERLWGKDYTHNLAGTRVIDDVRHLEISAITKLIRRRLLNEDRIMRLLICQKLMPQEWFRHWKDFDSPDGLLVREFEEMYMDFQEWEARVIRELNPQKPLHRVFKKQYEAHNLFSK